MLKQRILSIVLILATLFSLVGCSKTEEAYIYFELPELPTTLDPQTAKTDAELLIVSNIYEGLVRKDQNGNVTNGVAENFTKNGLSYTFKIREDANWNNGDAVTANDFVFAFKRAVNPETKAPFASRLYCIKNGKSINKGRTSVENLGVKAIDDKTLKITLSYDDPKFLENLTTSVAMPCNEFFFYESAGKYGLFRDTVTGNGSYRLTKWNKEVFGIRLYKNEFYNGDFIAKNAAVFLTCNNDEPVTTKLKENNVDIAFIDCSLTDEMHSAGFGTVDFQNICWVLTFNDDLSFDMRTALTKLIGKEVYENSLKNGYAHANTLFPNIFDVKVGSKGITKYDLSGGKELYNKEVLELEDKKFPSNATLYYYDNGNVKPIVTDIVGHWQSNLAAFVNIESASSPEVLLPELKEQTLFAALFPVRADSTNLKEYLENYGVSYNNQNLSNLQGELLESGNIVPIMFQNTTLCYSPAIKEIYTTPDNGYIDFSLIVKEE